MNNERTNLDVNRMYGGHLGQTYYEYKDEKKGDKYNLQPKMMRTWQLRRIPIIASPKDPASIAFRSDFIRLKRDPRSGRKAMSHAAISFR